MVKDAEALVMMMMMMIILMMIMMLMMVIMMRIMLMMMMILGVIVAEQLSSYLCSSEAFRENVSNLTIFMNDQNTHVAEDQAW